MRDGTGFHKAADVLHGIRAPARATDGAAPCGDEALTGDIPTLDELEARYLRRVMERCAGRVQGSRGAAALLKIKPMTLYARLRRHGIIARSYQ